MPRQSKSAASEDAAYETSDMSASAPSGYANRMMSAKPRKGMEPTTWGGRQHFRCPRCKRDTFNPKAAKEHRCD